MKIQIVLFILLLFLNNNAIADATSQKHVTGLKVFHRSGQTFLVWNGIEKYDKSSVESNVPEGLLQSDFRRRIAVLEESEKTGSKIRYHVYRSDKHISVNSLSHAVKIAEVKPLSSYYQLHTGMYWKEDKNKNGKISRFCVEPEIPLDDGQELFVFDVKDAGNSYYAVLTVVNDKEISLISDANSLISPLEEKPGEPEPVLQRIRTVGGKEQYLFQNGPAKAYYYIRWVSEPYSNAPSCFEWVVTVPGSYSSKKPCVLQLALHAWGGNVDKGTYWYNVKPSTIRIASVNYPVQDWWYGYRESYGISKPDNNDIVFNYTERRLKSFIKWVQSKWEIDKDLIFVEGQSMGGAGAISLGMKNGDMFCYANSWVGIASWRNSQYFRKGEWRKWGKIDELMNYNGIKFDDWMDLTWWLREYPGKETPFLSFANGKNDAVIGWYQAVIAVQALRETKRPFAFRWGLLGHGQSAKFMMDRDTMALNQSIPAFQNCSLDKNIGTGRKLEKPNKVKTREGKVIDDWYDGDPVGQINNFLNWKDAVDKDNEFEITVYLTKDAPENSCKVDMTPRRLQKFKINPFMKLNWKNLSLVNNIEMQSGDAVADENGLVTVENLEVSKGGNRITITSDTAVIVNTVRKSESTVKDVTAKISIEDGLITNEGLDASKSSNRIYVADGKTITVNTVWELETAVKKATPGTTILVNDGIYEMTKSLNFSKDKVILRSKNGNRGKVVLRGNGMKGGRLSHIIHILASDITVADLSLGLVTQHGIQIHGENGAMRPLMYNLRVFDCGQQLIKVSVGGGGAKGRKYSDGGELAFSLLEYTDHAPSSYTNGIDVLAGKGWLVRDNKFVRIRGPEGQPSGAAILFWQNSIDTVVERNLLIECFKGIAIGNPSGPNPNRSRNGESVYDHQGSIVRNNIIVRMDNGDSGIEFNRAKDYECYYNIVYVYSTSINWAIEYRFKKSKGIIKYNLSNMPIFKRDNAHAFLEGNLTNLKRDWFVDIVNSDFALTESAKREVNKTIPVPEVVENFHAQLQKGE